MAIPYHQWMSLPLSTRMKIAAAMNIPKLRSTHVANDQVLDDGYNVKDVEEAIKVIPMQNYLNSTETDITILFKTLIDTVESRASLVAKKIVEHGEEIVEHGEEIVDRILQSKEAKPIKKKPGRKSKAK